jgi:hypothetical protein
MLSTERKINLIKKWEVEEKEEDYEKKYDWKYVRWK